jgi:hypothetical protein
MLVETIFLSSSVPVYDDTMKSGSLIWLAFPGHGDRFRRSWMQSSQVIEEMI